MAGECNYHGLRTPDGTYVEQPTGEKELYDLRSDPFEVNDRRGATDYAVTEQSLAQRLDELRYCSGVGCR